MTKKLSNDEEFMDDEYDDIYDGDDDGNDDEVDEKITDDSVVLSKHKAEGKHSLKYDTIFKGKKEDPLSEDDLDGFALYHKEGIEVDKSSNFHKESIDNEDYVRDKLLEEKVYEVLSEKTEINFLNNRRKPSKIDFNIYYQLLKEELDEYSFTNVELFNTLSVYFSDNTFNMFKLLDKKWVNLILSELEEHIGKNDNSKEVKNRNIYVGTEIEFTCIDIETNEEKIITGVVLETNYEDSKFKVDSYENIYSVDLEDINKILNNTKFKYNLNKLKNIDFL